MSRRSAFSLIELLVVMSIIAVLAAVLMPAMNLLRDQSKSVVCLGNLRSAGMGLIILANENHGILPWGEAAPSGQPYSWSSALNTLDDKIRLTCPAAPVQGGSLHFTANLQTLPCRAFGIYRSTLKPVRLDELQPRSVLIFDAGLGQNPNGMNAFLTSMNMGFTFYFMQNNASDQTPQPVGSNGPFMVQNRHGGNRRADYLFGDGHVECVRPGDLTYADFRIQSGGRRYY